MVSPCDDGTREVMGLIANARFEALCCSAATPTILPFNIHHDDRYDRAETWHRIAFQIPLCINGFRHRDTRAWERRMKRTRLMQRRRTVGLSQEALAEQLGVDVSSVRRWEYGERLPQPWQRPNLATALKISVDQLATLLGDADEAPEAEHREVMAALFADAWGTPTPLEVLQPPLSSDPQPLAAVRTLKELGIFVRCDVLTRRETLTQAVKVISGPALLASIAGWLNDQPQGLEARDQRAQGTQRIGVSDVEALERSTRFFAATDAEIGGALSREAAVGQLKYAVDLAKYAGYSNAIGNRLLAVIAELSGLVGYICHDSGMPGPVFRTTKIVDVSRSDVTLCA